MTVLTVYFYNSIVANCEIYNTVNVKTVSDTKITTLKNC